MKFLLGHRFWMHFPLGAINGLAIIYLAYPKDVIAGFVLMIAFLSYEMWQGYRMKDMAQRDIIGWSGGLFVTFGGWLIYRLAEWIL